MLYKRARQIKDSAKIYIKTYWIRLLPVIRFQEILKVLYGFKIQVPFKVAHAINLLQT